MNRLNFYQINTVNDTKELDFISNSLTKFKMTYQPRYYRVRASDIMRPEMISFQVYGSTDFWWILMVVNKITNPLVELQPGLILEIPNQLDIFDFQKKYRLRRS